MELAMEEELNKGRDMANQLLEVLVHHKSNVHDGSSSMPSFVEDLVRKVMCSFTNSLLLLNTNYKDVFLNDVHLGIPMPIDKCSKHQEKDTYEAKNHGRACYKRKSSEPTWETDSSIQLEDGYLWRKYGQKLTLNAKYLRSYYRCSCNYDEGCPATKQVQRIQEDPPLYRTTYYDHHNCKSSLSPELMMETASSSSGSSMILSFSNTFTSKEEFPFSSSLSSSMKQEPMEVFIPEEDHRVQNQLDFNYSRHVTTISTSDSVRFDEVRRSDLYFDG